MKHIAYTLALLLSASGITASAATPDQMEKARVVAIKACLRDLNDGSDYLDKLNPASLADLEKNLKTKEQENIKKLKGIKLPTQEDYGSWGSEEFTRYWSKDFVKKAGAKSPSFTGSKIEASVKSINVTKSVPAEESKQPAAAATAQPGKDTLPPTAAVAVPEAAAIVPASEAAAVPMEEVKPAPAPEKKDSSNTASIVILCILVLVVVALVGYALNVMKKNKIRQSEAMRRSRRRAEEEGYGGYEAPTVQTDPEEESPFAAYSSYQEPVRQRPAADPRDREIERLRAEIAALQRKLGNAERYQPSEVPATPRPARHRVIFLAQANADGVFTRADAHYNNGISIFKLVTTDGVSGSYSVIEDPSVFEIALMMPTDFLINACEGRNLQLSEGARIIINEASGTAIFEDGRWRVSRKARIRYSR